jgi:sporulation protein YlmC with PRC-barrel domain
MTERVLYAGRQLLDRQIATIEGRSVGKVDDLEIDLDHPGGPVVSALLTGQIALGARFRGRLSVWVTSVAQRLRDTGDISPRRLDIRLVSSVEATVTLRVPYGDLEPADLEGWLAEHFIGRIPGA